MQQILQLRGKHKIFGEGISFLRLKRSDDEEIAKENNHPLKMHIEWLKTKTINNFKSIVLNVSWQFLFINFSSNQWRKVH
jgi:hypothetical protein